MYDWPDGWGGKTRRLLRAALDAATEPGKSIDAQRERERRAARDLLRLLGQEDADTWDGPQLVDMAIAVGIAEIRGLRAKLERLARAVKDALAPLEAVGLDCSALRDALPGAEALERNLEAGSQPEPECSHPDSEPAEFCVHCHTIVPYEGDE